ARATRSGGCGPWRVRVGRRRKGGATAGRGSLVDRAAPRPSAPPEFVVRQLLRRTGVVFRKTLARERQPLPWRDLVRACRSMEAPGGIRGGPLGSGLDRAPCALPPPLTPLPP